MSSTRLGLSSRLCQAWAWRAALLLLLTTLAACQGGTVVFAPTPVPLGSVPARYSHPSGAFTLAVPPSWALDERHTTELASATFSPPGDATPRLHVVALRLAPDVVPTSAEGLLRLIDAYQTTLRPGAARLVEQDRSAMADGSWRVVSVLANGGGGGQALNTFFEQRDDLLLIAEASLPDDPAVQQALEAALGTLQAGAANTLTPTAPEVLRQANAQPLALLNVRAWSTEEGVFFITGEVANTTDVWANGLPLRALQWSDSGVAVAEALGGVMSYGVPPGGFAPFSLRFGEGQLPRTTSYTLALGGPAWRHAENSAPQLTAPDLSWTDSASLDAAGRLVVVGVLTNTSAGYAYTPRVTVTAFDAEQRVVGAAFADVAVVELAPGASVAFEVVLPELAEPPSRTLVSAQARP